MASSSPSSGKAQTRKASSQTSSPPLRTPHQPLRAARCLPWNSGLRHSDLAAVVDAGIEARALVRGALCLVASGDGATRANCPASTDLGECGRLASRRGLFLSSSRRDTRRCSGRAFTGSQRPRRPARRPAHPRDRSDRTAAPRGRRNRRTIVCVRSRPSASPRESRRRKTSAAGFGSHPRTHRRRNRTRRLPQRGERSFGAISANTSTTRWLVRQSKFREKGVPHTLVVLLDVSRALREEERSAWQEVDPGARPRTQ